VVAIELDQVLEIIDLAAFRHAHASLLDRRLYYVGQAADNADCRQGLP
jgi:hypothetical protein